MGQRLPFIFSAICATAISIAFIQCGSRAPIDVANLPDDSVYQLKSVWKDQTGVDFMLPQASGRIQVVAMIYTSCPNICPMITADLMRLETEVPSWRRSDIRFLLVSIDPDRDTPAAMKDFMEKRHLNPERWRFLTGSKNDVLDLSSVLGVKLDRQPDGNFAHTRVLTVLNAKGQIVHQATSLQEKDFKWREWLSR